MSNRKVAAFGSVSFIPGGGVSYRTREDAKGRAFDVKLGYAPASPGSFVGFNEDTYSLAIDYNFNYYQRGANENAPYLSWGLGAVLISFNSPLVAPYVPIRAGYEFKYGFIDLGAKILFGVLPVPEIRAGIGIPF